MADSDTHHARDGASGEAAPSTRARLGRGEVIPAHPLALTAARALDERHQRALTRYYLDAGAGGLAVGVHTTQFAIRDPNIGLYRPVLELAMSTVTATHHHPVMIAGVVGKTPQAMTEAEIAVALGYDLGLLSLGAWLQESEDDILIHCQRIADVIPLFGFFLQPAVGGRVLSYRFWREFAEIPNVWAIKIAPFNRYQTLDVVRAVAESGRDIALYTGNDDNIAMDLLTPHGFQVNGRAREYRVVGGLLGHWAVWTRRAVDLLQECHAVVSGTGSAPKNLLQRSAEITDTNAAFFDAPNNFAGC